MKKYCFILILLVLASVQCAFGQAKYVFLFIGDGMGVNQLNMTNAYLSSLDGGARGSQQLLFTSFPVFSVVTTFAANSDVTDSAASGTAIATGTKTNNGWLGVDPDNNPVYSIAVDAKKAGKKVGIATTVGINHATPGAFYGHQKSRNWYYEIGLDLLQSDFDFFGGAGFYNSNKTKDNQDAPDLYPQFEKAGYTIAKGFDDFKSNAKGKNKVILVPTNYEEVEIPYAIDRKPGDLSLAQITEAAIDVLTRNNNKGFFVMLEGGEIDHGAHGNDAASDVKEIIDMDEAIKVAYEFYKKHPKETLILITADHDTGGLTVSGNNREISNLRYQKQSQNGLTKKINALRDSKSDKKVSWEEVKSLLAENMGFWKEISISWEQEKALRDVYEKTLAKNIEIKDRNLYAENSLLAAEAKKVMSQVAGVSWATGGHSAGYVPIIAIGAGQECFSHKLDNTDIPKIIRKVAKY